MAQACINGTIGSFVKAPPNGNVMYTTTEFSTGYTASYTNITPTASGTSGTKTVTCSATVASLLRATNSFRLNGADVYTVASISTNIITTNEFLTSTYVAVPIAVNRATVLKDITGTGNDNTAASAAKSPILTPNQVNSLPSFQFNASNVLTVPMASGLQALPAGASTVALVVKRTVDSGLQIIFNQGTGAGNTKHAMYFNGAGVITFVNDPSNLATISLAGVLTTGFNVIIASWHPTNGFKISCNGMMQTTTGGAAVTGLDTSYWGSRSDSQFYLTGDMADGRFWNRELSVQEHKTLAQVMCKEWGITPNIVELNTQITGWDIWAQWGQSNNEGRTGPIDVTLDIPNPNISQWGRFAPYDGKIILAADPLDNVDPGGSSLGLGLAFAKQYLAGYTSAGRGVMIVPGSKGSTGFSNAQWNPGNALYEDGLARTIAALASNPANSLKGIIWHQGEQDFGQTQAYYAAHLDAMLLDARTRLGRSDLLFLCGGTLPGGTQTDPNIIAALVDTPNRNFYSAYAVNTGLTSSTDNLHFNPASSRTMAGRYYSNVAVALANH